MAEHKGDSGHAARLAQPRKANHDQATNDRGTGEERPGSGTGPADKSSAAVVPRKQQYLIGFRSLPGIAPLSSDPFLGRLSQMEGVEIIRRLRTRLSQPLAMPTPQLMSIATTGAQQEIVVARMDEQRGAALRQSAPPHVVVELDAPLGYSHMAAPELISWQLAARATPVLRPRRELLVRILGEGDRPLANAVVNLYGPGFPAQAITDASGQAILQADVNGAGALAIYVRPAADYWERSIQNPSLEPGEVNVIRLSPLERATGKAPVERPYTWGQRIMKLDRAPADWSGEGTRIGLIDSGCDSSHPQLRHIVRGADVSRDNDAQSWKTDEFGHGTHCAGIIAASAGAPSGIVGCAPGSEVHVFKVVPGGHFSDLIDALDQCIARRLDIVHIGVSGDQFSELVAQKITEARLHGIACVAAAGNSGAAVQFPGNVPGVLTVAAVGKLGEYPEDTRHARRALPQFIGLSGIYATNFSGWGPQVAVCAPGVAVVSSVPGDGYAAWDGSTMAAAHVVGLSALLLSHHPLLQSTNFGSRAEQRVALLFDFLRAAAMQYAHVNPNRVGAGLPDLQQVTSLFPTNLALASQGFYGVGAGMLQARFPLPAEYFANSMNTMLQLQAAGLLPAAGQWH
jgi:subtilisin